MRYGFDCERTIHTKWEAFRCEVSMYWFEYRSGFKLHLLLLEIYGRLNKHYFSKGTHDRIFMFDKDKK
jgi:hypothetical protein